MNIQVAIGVVFDKKTHRILISQRPRGKPMAGYWEFAGGKVEPNETAIEAVTREFKEELAITVLECQIFCTIQMIDRKPCIDLWVFWIEAFSGRPRSMENQQFRWIAAQELRDYCFLPKNEEIIEKLERKLLPETYNHEALYPKDLTEVTT